MDVQTLNAEELQALYTKMLAAARAMFGKVTVETDLVVDKRQESLYLVTAQVRTANGDYNAWEIVSILSADVLDRVDVLDLRASVRALAKAGITSEGIAVPPAHAEPLPVLTVVPTSVFATTLTQPEQPEVARERCAGCNKPIKGYTSGAAFISAERVAEMTRERHGHPLCASCSAPRSTRKVVQNGGRRP